MIISSSRLLRGLIITKWLATFNFVRRVLRNLERPAPTARNEKAKGREVINPPRAKLLSVLFPSVAHERKIVDARAFAQAGAKFIIPGNTVNHWPGDKSSYGKSM